MSDRPTRLLYVINPDFIADLSDSRGDLLDSISSIIEGFEGLMGVLKSLNIPDYEEVFGEYQPLHPTSPPQSSYPF